MSTFSSNEGTINTSMPLTKEARDIINGVLMGDGFEITAPGTITFTGYYDRDFSVTAKNLIEVLSPLGYTLSGSVDCDGGFGNGRMVIRNNAVTFLNSEEMAIADAADEALVNELKNRGFSVTKENEMTLTRAVELLNSVVDHVSAANNTSGSISELMSMGFETEDLVCFGFTKEDIESWSSEQGD